MCNVKSYFFIDDDSCDWNICQNKSILYHILIIVYSNANLSSGCFRENPPSQVYFHYSTDYSDYLSPVMTSHMGTLTSLQSLAGVFNPLFGRERRETARQERREMSWGGRQERRLGENKGGGCHEKRDVEKREEGDVMKFCIDQYL